MKNDRTAAVAYLLAVLVSLAIVALDLFMWRPN